MARDRFKAISDAPHFFTFTTLDWIPVFHDRELAEIVLDSLRFMQEKGMITLYGFVVMENHAHVIMSADELTDKIKRFKSYTARAILDKLTEKNRQSLLRLFRDGKADFKTESDYQFWQQGSHPEIILDGDMMRQKLNYIHQNPVRRGYVDSPEHWRYSSARDYAGEKGIIPLNGKNLW